MLGKLTKSVDVIRAGEQHEAGAVLLDVRTRKEWKDLRVPTATHLPLTGLDQRSQMLQKRYQDKTVLVICRSGNRSARAAAHLRRLGLDAWNVRGGIDAWRKKGLPVIGPSI